MRERDEHTQPDHQPVEQFSTFDYVLRVHVGLLHRALARCVSWWGLNVAYFYYTVGSTANRPSIDGFFQVMSRCCYRSTGPLGIEDLFFLAEIRQPRNT